MKQQHIAQLPTVVANDLTWGSYVVDVVVANAFQDWYSRASIVLNELNADEQDMLCSLVQNQTKIMVQNLSPPKPPQLVTHMSASLKLQFAYIDFIVICRHMNDA